MNWRFVTVVLLTVGTGLVLAYDACAMAFGGSEATISDIVLRASLKRPIIPFAVGLLIGHLFASQAPPAP